ncbi:LLM class flavin-dependent oxidoreductase [Rhodococcus qingshengii]|uniref:LLM class flavin-dependent oxidoreductase n=1 Tax=Rhodococcus qingshengii TaxID=334542 RepID=UPI002034B427|nr:LLM class flavin-dependent oxidoreductase [Rhodococcus qingshengii]
MSLQPGGKRRHVYGGAFTRHDDRYRQATEFVDILRGLWKHTSLSYQGEHFSVRDSILSLKSSQNSRRE